MTEPSDQYMRRRLAVIARQWDGGKASAYRLVAWILDNGGYGKLSMMDGICSVYVTGRDGRDMLIGKDEYVIKDADNAWSSKVVKDFEQYFEPQPQVATRTALHDSRD